MIQDAVEVVIGRRDRKTRQEEANHEEKGVYAGGLDLTIVFSSRMVVAAIFNCLSQFRK